LQRLLQLRRELGANAPAVRLAALSGLGWPAHSLLFSSLYCTLYSTGSTPHTTAEPEFLNF
jgi:hypothetical protein